MEEYTKYPNKAGVYKLTCVETNKVYIGKSINLKNRLSSHKNCGKRLKGRCYFENVIIKYGWDAFKVEILEIFEGFDKFKDNNILLDKESYYIDLFEASNKEKGYNICKRSVDRTGMTHTDESKRKMSESRKGIKKSEETKEKMRQARLGKKLSDETKKKIGLVHLGRKQTKEHVEKNRIARSGRITSEETREKLRKRKNNLGNKHSEESKEKMRRSRLAYIEKSKLNMEN